MQPALFHFLHLWVAVATSVPRSLLRNVEHVIQIASLLRFHLVPPWSLQQQIRCTKPVGGTLGHRSKIGHVPCEKYRMQSWVDKVVQNWRLVVWSFQDLPI
jgi:hypothetical protein